MKRTRHTPEQVIRKLREADRMLAEQKTVAEIAKELGVSETRITAGAISTAGYTSKPKTIRFRIVKR